MTLLVTKSRKINQERFNRILQLNYQPVFPISHNYTNNKEIFIIICVIMRNRKHRLII